MIKNPIILRYLIKENIYSFLIIFSFSCLLFISIDLIELIRRSSSKDIDFFNFIKNGNFSHSNFVSFNSSNSFSFKFYAHLHETQ